MKAMSKVTVPASKVQIIEGVQVIGICDLLQTIFGEDHWRLDYDVTSEAVKKWCSRHGAHYYAEERWGVDEHGYEGRLYSTYKGACQAKRYGFRIVVCEDLS